MLPIDKQSDQPPAKRTPHHYEFAHVALRQIAFADPYGFFTIMAFPKRQEFLEDIWAQICQNCDKDGTASFTPEDITVQTTKIEDFPTILVVMPKPHFIPEAYMVCLVLQVPIAEMAQGPDNPEIRYFTLEKGINLETDADRTVLCEWKGDTHLNYGDGPEATPTAFLAKVEELIAKMYPRPSS